jgi:ADP-ribosylglycohydrolase
VSNDAPPTSRFTGCILDQAIGDALGFPVEGYGPARTSAAVIPFPGHFTPSPFRQIVLE